jgi:hypothetical protein
MRAMQIRPARGDEAAAITALGLRSKAHWGYDDDFMARCAAELRWDEDDLREGARRAGEVRSPSTGRMLPRLVIATA